ncbi:MAG TPA: SDR family oxidoreductase [Candidatus Hydrogenedentes bacterium]|nr:SDR family oxidoreductase [Candidatus Hydrogenedentota bacterium]
MGVFTGQVIVVTGASEGIGRALCMALAQQRPKLALAARNRERLETLKADVEALGAEALVVPLDVTDEAACKSLIDQTVAAFGRLDVLVNNAGGTMWAKLEDIQDTSIFERLMRLNYLGSVFCTYYALPHLKKAQGRIVGIASVAGLNGVPTRSGYSASKHAMFGFFDSLRIEVKEYGVSVTMVAPDFVLSEVHRRALDAEGKPLGVSPMQEKKIMTAEQCAAMIVTAMERRQRLLITSLRGKLGRWLKVLAPSLIDRIAAKAISDRK